MAVNQEKHLVIKNVFSLSLTVFLLGTLSEIGSTETKSVVPYVTSQPSQIHQGEIKKVHITLSVRGPGIHQEKFIGITPGSTVSQVLDSNYDIHHSKVCASQNDIWSINGIPTVPGESFWVIKVNGNSQNVSSQTALFESDVLDLVYMTKLEYQAEHQYLERWLSEAGR